MKRKVLFTVSTLCLLTCVVWLQPPSSVVASRPHQQSVIAKIDFFGYGHFDVVKLRSSLPIKQGESIKDSSDWSAYRSRIDEAIRAQTGKPPTDVARVCCDENGNSMIYIGVAGATSVAVHHKRPPTGKDRLPEAALKLSHETEEALNKAVVAGRTQQDNSNGYALSADPELRAKELQIREFALGHEDLLRTVLSSSSDAEHRAIAAQFLGYVNVSARQISVLTDAARDPDEGVRNNAVRALGVIAGSSQQRARMIRPKPFIALLKSDKWVDRNKGAWLLVNLTASRDPQLLQQLRKEALDALIEMARWQFAGHASFARRLLGRFVPNLKFPSTLFFLWAFERKACGSVVTEQGNLPHRVSGDQTLPRIEEFRPDPPPRADSLAWTSRAAISSRLAMGARRFSQTVFP